MIAATVGAILLATVTLYAILGGADFGGGLWDLLAGGDRRGRAPRTLIDESITPVWEANHVWLVFALVIFWTAFPDAFAAVMTVAALPIWLAVAGIVLRGAGFAFRKEVTRLSLERALGATFAFSSLLTPFFMGAVVGGIADGQIPDRHTEASLAAWTQPTSVLTGFLFVGACGYLAAVYLIGEAARRGEHRMQTYFTRRAQLAAVLTGALSLATLAELHSSDPTLYHRLTGRALPLVIVAGVSGVAVLALLTRPAARRPGAGRARRGRGGVGLGGGPVPGAAARHLGDGEQRGRPGVHADRDRGAVRRARRADRALVRAAVRVAGPPVAAGRRETPVLATAAAPAAVRAGARPAGRPSCSAWSRPARWPVRCAAGGAAADPHRRSQMPLLAWLVAIRSRPSGISRPFLAARRWPGAAPEEWAMASTVADLIVATLRASGVQRVYGIPGDSLNGFTDALRRDGSISWEHVRHEEAAAFAAAGEAALTGQLAVCAASCGPGNLHLINGLFDANRSRVPVLAIASHIPRDEIGSDYFQETHPQNLFQECSVYCELISVPEQIPRVLDIGMRTALERGGVAVIVVPGDVFFADAPPGPR